jgi:hypothetical protein
MKYNSKTCRLIKYNSKTCRLIKYNSKTCRLIKEQQSIHYFHVGFRTLLLGLLSIIIFLSGSTMGDYMRPKTAPGSEGGATLFTLRYFTQQLYCSDISFKLIFLILVHVQLNFL